MLVQVGAITDWNIPNHKFDWTSQIDLWGILTTLSQWNGANSHFDKVIRVVSRPSNEKKVRILPAIGFKCHRW